MGVLTGKRLSDDDLILSPSGRIYHLDVLPEHVADTVITVGDPDRATRVAECFDSIEYQHRHREFVTITGYRGAKRLTVLSTGMGTQNIDIVLNELDALLNVDFTRRCFKEKIQRLTVIRLGTSGSISAEIPVGSLLLSSHAIDLTGVMAHYALEPNEAEAELTQALNQHLSLEFERMPANVFSGSEQLLEQFMQTGTYLSGITATCNGFYAAQDRHLRAPIRQAGIIKKLQDFEHRSFGVSNLEMETAALYGFCRLLGHRCLSVNAIVADRINQQFCDDIASLEARCIETSLKVLSNG